MRVPAALIILICCSAVGVRKSFAIKKRVVFIDGIISMLTEFAIDIRFQLPTLEELIRNQHGEFAEKVKHIIKSGSDVRTAWESACREYRSEAAEIALLCEFGRAFGNSDGNGELQLIQLYIERFSKLREAAFKEYSHKGKAAAKVGVLCGAAGAVLVL